MTKNEMRMKMKELTVKRHQCLIKLEEPARAACNAMIDAGMKETALPIKIILNELDVLNQEMVEMVKIPGFLDIFIEVISE